MKSTSTPELKPCDDRQLIQRFDRDKDEEAFAQLVQRHGPMVLQVCRRTLGRQQDAEDAFQAVFMVLARKAGKVRWQKSLAKWLYSVAIRISLKANSRMQKRLPESELTIDLVEELIDPEQSKEEFPAAAEKALYEEISQLPAKLQEPIILCSLEGQTRPAAAEALGIKETTLNGRMERARALLRKRLLKREIVLPGAVLAGTLIPSVAEAGFSTSLIFSPASVATKLTAGTTLTGHLGASAVKLAQGELATMLMVTKLKIVAATVAVVISVGMGSLLVPGIGIGKDTSLHEAENLKVAELKEDLDDFQKQLIGEWQVVSVGGNGDYLPDARAQEIKLSFTETHLSMWAKGKKTEFEKTPYELSKLEGRAYWALDMEVLREGERGINPGIIQVNGDELQFCFSDEAERPFAFTTEDGDSPNENYFVARRIKKGAQPSIDEVRKILIGEWQVLSVHHEGQDVTPADKSNLKFTITPTTLKISMHGNVDENEYELDPSNPQKRLSLYSISKVVSDLPVRLKENKNQAIYELNQDDLKICLNMTPDGKYPNRFASEANPSPNNLLYVLKRIEHPESSAVSEVKKQLLGKWVIKSINVNDPETVFYNPPRGIVYVLEFTKDELLISETVQILTFEQKFKYELDLSSEPRKLNISHKPTNMDFSQLGATDENLRRIFTMGGQSIFKLEDGKLTVCLNKELYGNTPEELSEVSEENGRMKKILFTAERVEW